MKFRFTLRDLFWFVLVVAMGVGWVADRERVRSYCIELNRSAIEGLHAEIECRDRTMQGIEEADILLREEIAQLQGKLDSANKELSRRKE